MTTILQTLGCKGNILVVDDEPDNLEVLSIILESEGYQVRQAINANIALKTIKLKLPELILLDIKMPEIDGYQLCQKLKSNSETKDIPVIFLSGLARDIDKCKGFEVGAVDFIIKPFHLQETLARVKHQLTIRKLELELQQRNHELSQQNNRLETEVYIRQQAENELESCKLLLEAKNRQIQTIFDNCHSLQAHS
ncbi:response regulator containing a CheY-like receiver domain and a GGDEF domain [Rivularia sp. PCC 7116]|uniref:response regulator n=1 Tax=Rivularia sp. PCC 7116 TaxID=373994 RepID=UPI00029EC8D9|nr:response regulator [Rivularia sp. PCC 7116]AFY53437.1 response regulator containing a CheY-like receiver domain and a GGDEF domain [Rivularia sp. PCC 7116]